MSDCCNSKNPKWKEDFPVQWEKDNYITRREMVKFLGLGSMFLAGAQFVAAGVPLLQKPQAFPRARIANAMSFGDKGSMLFSYPTKDDPAILLKKADGSFRAYSQVCTHLSCAVVHKEQQDTLFCPAHNGYFSPEDGRVTAGPPSRGLPKIRLEVEDGVIYAVGVEV